MKKVIIIYSFLLFQIINAQQNDITSLMFTWVDQANNFGEVGVQVLQNFQSNNLVRWNCPGSAENGLLFNLILYNHLQNYV